MKKTKLFAKLLCLGAIALASTAVFSQNRMPQPQKEELLNGLKVLMWANPQADKVWVKIRVHSGSAFDPQGREGVMQMLADDLFPNASTKEFFAEDLGGSLEVTANYDYIQIDASSKPESLLTMLETLSTAVANPVIDKETTEKLQTALIAKVKSLESNPGYVADQAAAKRLLGTFPYGRPQMGTEASLQKIEFPDLIDAKARFLTADNATITVSGNFDKSLAFKAIRRYFGGWLKADKKVPATFRQPDAPPSGLLTLPSPKADAAAIAFAFRGTARNSPDFAPAGVYSFILRQRLEKVVPAADASQIYVLNDAHLLPGIFFIDFSMTKEPSINNPVNANDIVGKALADPVTDAEFATAQTAADAAWRKRSMEDLWLDVDTYKTQGAESDRNAVSRLKAADVRAYAEKLKASPGVTVLVNTPPTK